MDRHQNSTEIAESILRKAISHFRQMGKSRGQASTRGREAAAAVGCAGINPSSPAYLACLRMAMQRSGR